MITHLTSVLCRAKWFQSKKSKAVVEQYHVTMVIAFFDKLNKSGCLPKNIQDVVIDYGLWAE